MLNTFWIYFYPSSKAATNHSKKIKKKHYSIIQILIFYHFVPQTVNEKEPIKF